MTLKFSLDLDELTYGQLYNFVDYARGAGIPADEKVSLVLDPLATEDVVVGLEVQLPDDDVRKAPDFSDLDRDHLAAVLEAVIKAEGDARLAIHELMEIRDRLL